MLGGGTQTQRQTDSETHGWVAERLRDASALDPLVPIFARNHVKKSSNLSISHETAKMLILLD